LNQKLSSGEKSDETCGVHEQKQKQKQKQEQEEEEEEEEEEDWNHQEKKTTDSSRPSRPLPVFLLSQVLLLVLLLLLVVVVVVVVVPTARLVHHLQMRTARPEETFSAAAVGVATGLLPARDILFLLPFLLLLLLLLLVRRLKQEPYLSLRQWPSGGQPILLL
jgi:hypothetical protein